MVRKGILLIAIALLGGQTSAYCQDNEDYISEGLFRNSGTFSYGFMNDNVSNNYVSGLIEYYVDDKVSIRGDAAYFVGHQSEFKPLLKNHQLFAGGMYHFEANSSTLDPFVGISPGIALSQRDESILGGDTLIDSDATFNPVLGFTGGLNYYSGKFFHFFIEARFIRGVHLANSTPKYLDEFRLSFGLGWDIRFK